MKCKYCGTELSADASSCIECGRLVDKTQVSIVVKRESFYSEFRWKVLGHPFLWIFYLGKETLKVKILIDEKNGGGKFFILKPQKEPYKIELDPGYHEIIFENENADNQNKARNFRRVLTGVTIGAMVHGMTDEGGIDTFSNIMDATEGNKVGNGYATFILQSGDTYELICRPTKKGDVKVWTCKK